MSLSLVQVFEQLSETSSRKEKEAILSANKDQLFYEVLLAALDPYRTYGFQDVPIPNSPLVQHHTVEQERDNWIVFLSILQDLAARHYTGNAAKELINGYFVGLTVTELKWFKRVLLKNLRCGVEAKTVNKVVPGLIPQFNIALADTLEFDDKGFPEITFPVWVDFKIDGLRCVTIKEGDSVNLFSRKGHPIETLPSVVREVERIPGSFVLDGEAMDSQWSQSLTTIRSTKNKVSDENITYNVFDCLKLEEWKAQRCTESYEFRQSRLNELVSSAPLEKVQLIPGMVVLNPYDLEKFYKRALDAGYEGVMIKKLQAVYEFKRSKAVLKYKPFISEEGQIDGWEFGDPNGKRAGKFGSFNISFKQSQGTPTNVGGGFDDAMIDEITRNITVNPNHYNGMIAEVKGKGFTEDGFMREPVFLRFRSEEDV